MANPEQDQTAEQAEASEPKKTTSEVLTNLYWQRRVEYQLEYYQDRAREYEQHVDVAFRLGAILMTFSSLLASLGVVLTNDPTIAPLISLMTAIIPAIVSYIAAFRQLYQWDRQLALYRDTQLNLESAKLAMPDIQMLNSALAEEKFPELVSRVEGVLKEEISQWGRIARGEEEDDEAEQDLTATLRLMLADSDGEVNEDKLNEILKVFNANQGTPDAGQYRLAPDELETRTTLLDDNFYDQSEIRAQEARERRERQAALARAAAQEAALSQQDPQASIQPTLPSATAPSAQATAVIAAPVIEEAIVIEETPIIEADPIVETTPEPTIVEEPTIEDEPTQPDPVVVEEPVLIDATVVDDAIAPVEESPIVATDTASPTVTINQETVNIGEDVAVDTSSPEPDPIVIEEPDPDPIVVEQPEPDHVIVDEAEPIADDTAPEPIAPVIPDAADAIPFEDEPEIVDELEMPELEVFEEEFGNEEDEDELYIADPLETLKFNADNDIEDDSDYADTYDDETDDYDIEELD